MTPDGRTVGDAMLRHPTVHRTDVTVGETRAVFETSPKTHLLLLVDDGHLVATVDCDGLARPVSMAAPAAGLGSLVGRTVAPGVPLEGVRRALADGRRRRLAVVDPSMRLLGLLCLQRNLMFEKNVQTTLKLLAQPDGGGRTRVRLGSPGPESPFWSISLAGGEGVRTRWPGTNAHRPHPGRPCRPASGAPTPREAVDGCSGRGHQLGGAHAWTLERGAGHDGDRR